MYVRTFLLTHLFTDLLTIIHYYNNRRRVPCITLEQPRCTAVWPFVS